jgi:hypothetical protein
MKKAIACSAILFCTFVLFPSCTKSSKDDFSQPTANPDKVINAKVAPGETYILSVASTGNVSIYQQASHYQLSQTGFDEKMAAPVYKYIPASGFTGADKVILVHTIDASTPGSSNGCNNGEDHESGKTTFIAVNITVQ